MAKSDAGKNGEWIQILILTLAMTGGGFLLLFLVLSLFILPGKQADVDAEMRRYDKLASLLEGPEIAQLRAEHELQESKGDTRQLPLILSEELQALGLESGNRVRTGRKVVGSLIRDSQKIVLKTASMDRILRYVVRVTGAKKTIRLERMRLNRKRSRNSDDTANEWDATLDFVDFLPQQPS